MTLANKEHASVESLEGIMSQIDTLKCSLQTLVSADSRVHSTEEFHFSRNDHISITQPDTKLTFSDLSLSLPAAASSPIAATEPFPLFTPAAIPLIRKALLDESYISKTGCIFGPKTLVVRNTAAHSPFFRRIMSDPYVLAELSRAAGVELEPVMETMELGHANVQVDFAKYGEVKGEHAKLKAAVRDLMEGGLDAVPDCSREVRKREDAEIRKELEGALMPWHLDSYPWVCVAMLSDTTGMVGGETVIETGAGSYKGVAQPGAGHAMMLQGGLIKHLALPCSGTTDRITLVTSFRPRSPFFYDSCFMSNIRPYSDLPHLYLQWIEYRLDRLVPGVNRLHNRQRFICAVDEVDQEHDQEERIVLREYAKRTLRQMVPPALVHDLVNRYGCLFFFTIRDEYLSGEIFKGLLKICRRCTKGEKVTKVHLAECSGAFKWRTESALWTDARDTFTELCNLENSFKTNHRTEDPQVKEVFTSWKGEKRHWGMADELAAQGLVEYLIDFLQFFKVL